MQTLQKKPSRNSAKFAKENQDPKTEYDISKNNDVDIEEVSLVSKQNREHTEKPLGQNTYCERETLSIHTETPKELLNTFFKDPSLVISDHLQ